MTRRISEVLWVRDHHVSPILPLIEMTASLKNPGFSTDIVTMWDFG